MPPIDPQAMSFPHIGLPETLRADTPVEGQALAWQLAKELLAVLPPRESMPEHLRTSAGRPAPEVVAAIYFHAISLANSGWMDRRITTHR
jgi:hypothetical protein